MARSSSPWDQKPVVKHKATSNYPSHSLDQLAGKAAIFWRCLEHLCTALARSCLARFLSLYQGTAVTLGQWALDRTAGSQWRTSLNSAHEHLLLVRLIGMSMIASYTNMCEPIRRRHDGSGNDVVEARLSTPSLRLPYNLLTPNFYRISLKDSMICSTTKIPLKYSTCHNISGSCSTSVYGSEWLQSLQSATAILMN